MTGELLHRSINRPSVSLYVIDLWSLSKQVPQLSVIKLKILRDALSASYYEVEVNCIITLYEEIQDHKPTISH